MSTLSKHTLIHMDARALYTQNIPKSMNTKCKIRNYTPCEIVLEHVIQLGSTYILPFPSTELVIHIL